MTRETYYVQLNPADPSYLFKLNGVLRDEFEQLDLAFEFARLALPRHGPEALDNILIDLRNNAKESNQSRPKVKHYLDAIRAAVLAQCTLTEEQLVACVDPQPSDAYDKTSLEYEAQRDTMLQWGRDRLESKIKLYKQWAKDPGFIALFSVGYGGQEVFGAAYPNINRMLEAANDMPVCVVLPGRNDYIELNEHRETA